MLIGSVYLNLLRENVALYRVSLVGYCLMSNHIHLIAIPRSADGLAQALKHVHGRYASYWNAAHQSNGHVWQGRYYSCPLDEPHLWEALRYTELNPLRAGLVLKAESWPWSSAASHCGTESADASLALEIWRSRWTSSDWRDYLAAGESESRLAIIRQRTTTLSTKLVRFATVGYTAAGLREELCRTGDPSRVYSLGLLNIRTRYSLGRRKT
jgi:putative transposase